MPSRVLALCLAAVALLMALGAGAADDASGGIRSLDGFYNRVDNFSADFEQRQLNEEGEVMQQSSGRFLLSRPERFRWEYQKPYEQTIVSDGDTLRFYDVDLAQVTVRPVDQTLRATPALLLSGGTALDEAFDISDAGQRDGLNWVRLTPRDSDGDFAEIRMGLDDDVPVRMQLDDNLGQTTAIRFSNIEINAGVAADNFRLDVPDGVEIVDGRAAQVSPDAQTPVP